MKQLPFSQVYAFLAVARFRGFSAAARELGVSRSAVSQAVQQLEEQLRVVLLHRTTRSVSLTDAGRRLVETAGPGMKQTADGLAAVTARPGEAVGRLRLSVPLAAIPFVIAPVLPTFRARHPRVEVEVSIDERFVDIAAEGYDAGIRLSESIERDMLQVRLTDPFRFVVVGAPSYLDRRGTPERPEDLLEHECITYRMPSSGALYSWELERGKRSWRIPVRGGVVTNEGLTPAVLAEHGLGLAYAVEPLIREQLRSGKLRCVLEPYAAIVPGYFIYFLKQARAFPPLRLFVDTAKEMAVRA